jgi:DNA-binding CsgD family transcriptional regulator
MGPGIRRDDSELAFWQPRRMIRFVLPYALALAVAAVLLEWLRFRHVTRIDSTEIYVAILAIGFIALGIWVGRRLTPQPRSEEFTRNDAAIRSLGLTERECEILAQLASGQSTKQLARTFSISPNTVKTHLARVFEKLEVQNRMQAVEKARCLALIP